MGAPEETEAGRQLQQALAAYQQKTVERKAAVKTQKKTKAAEKKAKKAALSAPAGQKGAACERAMGDLLQWAPADVLSGDQWNQFADEHPEHREVMHQFGGRNLCNRPFYGHRH